jgi:NAD(P)-dependent dehydrogenase (short-subunit alcohol dehydrogenase family)
MTGQLEGRVALITGGSRGIGRGIAEAFVAEGASVMITSRKIEALEATAAELDGDVAVYAANAGNVADADACVRATIERFGRLDILVNNAATNPYFGPMLEIDEARFDKTIAVNFRGPLFWAKAAWEQGFRDEPGVIINISSGGSVHVDPGIGLYNTAKAALNQMTRQLAFELAPTRVVGIAPGLVKTDFARVLVESFGDTMAARLPARRIGEPADIGALAAFLAGDSAGYITGETIMVTGGIASMPVNPE